MTDTEIFKPSHAENNKNRKSQKNIFTVILCSKEMENQS